MQTLQAVADYDWKRELEEKVVSSLATSFGLDFLLFQDKLGGDVDTIRNARKGIYASESERDLYANRPDYDVKVKNSYHDGNKNYGRIKERDRIAHENGELIDPYTGESLKGDRHLDHVISSREIHDDPGRILAGVDGAEAANRDYNLCSTNGTINTSKRDSSVEDFLKGHSAAIARKRDEIERDKARLSELRSQAGLESNDSIIIEIEKKIKKKEESLASLESVDAEAMRGVDAKARKEYEAEINKSYYAGAKFFKKTALAVGSSGLKMGVRQALGMVFAEIWFELRGQLPKLLHDMKHEFSLKAFLYRLKKSLIGIWERVRVRFIDFLIGFRDGVFSGVLSSAMTILFNIFFTTQKLLVKMIREVFPKLVEAIKLIVINPSGLGVVELCKAVMALMLSAVGVVFGSYLHGQLLPLLSFPFGAEIASFFSALATGVVAVGLTYAFFHSSFAKRVWRRVEAIVKSISPYYGVLIEYQKINSELDRYFMDLAAMEFAMDKDDLNDFSIALINCNDEIERSFVIGVQVKKMDISLPFEMGDHSSARKFIAGKIRA